jgi:hypothetical protein
MIRSLLPTQILGLYEVNSLRFFPLFFHFSLLYIPDSSLSSFSSYMWLFYLTTIICDFHRYSTARVSCPEMCYLEPSLSGNPQFSGKMMKQYFLLSFPCLFILGLSLIIFSFSYFSSRFFCRNFVIFILTIPLIFCVLFLAFSPSSFSLLCLLPQRLCSNICLDLRYFEQWVTPRFNTGADSISERLKAVLIRHLQDHYVASFPFCSLWLYKHLLLSCKPTFYLNQYTYVPVPWISNCLWIVDGVFLQDLYSSHCLSLYYDWLAKRISWYEQWLWPNLFHLFHISCIIQRLE